MKAKDNYKMWQKIVMQSAKEYPADANTHRHAFQAGGEFVYDLIAMSRKQFLIGIFERMNRDHITMLEIGEYEKLADTLEII